MNVDKIIIEKRRNESMNCNELFFAVFTNNNKYSLAIPWVTARGKGPTLDYVFETAKNLIKRQINSQNDAMDDITEYTGLHTMSRIQAVMEKEKKK